MPSTPDETTEKEVLYPDDLTGESFTLRRGPVPDDAEIDGEVVLWHADEDRDALPDGAKAGWFLPIEHPSQGSIWAAAPRELRESLTGLGPGDTVKILSCEKGPGDTDPYHVEVEYNVDL